MNRIEPKVLDQLEVGASMRDRMSTLKLTRCNPVALYYNSRETVSNLGPMGQISCFDSRQPNVLGSR